MAARSASAAGGGADHAAGAGRAIRDGLTQSLTRSTLITAQPQSRRASAGFVPLPAPLLGLGVAVAGFVAGVVVRWPLARPAAAAWIWGVAVLITGVPFVWQTLRDLLRGRFAADVIAAVAVAVAFAQAEYAAAAVIMMMLTTGQALEAYGRSRASDALAALLARAPRVAHRRAADVAGAPVQTADLEDIAVDEISSGDRLVIRPGELIPVDSVVIDGESTVDESALTGEPLPVSKSGGAELRSGTVNMDGALEARALRPAADSEYAQVVRLMEAAQLERAAVQRTADRVAVWLTPFTLAVAGAAYLLSGDPGRVLSVLVVATPCPLILATPIALIAGINRAAGVGVVVKNGAALEALSRVTAAVFDKTGTLTYGRPEVVGVRLVAPDVTEGDVLAVAAAVEQRSSHLLARAIVAEAERRGIDVPEASAFHEIPGRGARAVVVGHEVMAGSREYVAGPASDTAMASKSECARMVGEATARAQLVTAVGVDGTCAGLIVFADVVRPGLSAFIARLRGLGVTRTVMLTGDRVDTARAVGAQAGIEDVRAGLLPGDKVAAIRSLRCEESGVLMAGDGINDAPALAAATVGVAMGARGAAISAAAADVVLLVDDVTRIADAVEIGRRTMRIVWQCIGLGLGLSAVAMAGAALGLVHPIAGAAIQEAIDLFVVLNALRAR